jgi:hypothetical protein
MTSAAQDHSETPAVAWPEAMMRSAPAVARKAGARMNVESMDADWIHG